MKNVNSRSRTAVVAVLFSTAIVVAGCSDHKVTKTTTTTEESSATTAPPPSSGSSSTTTTTTRETHP
jgi:hypothetical protein